MPEDLIIICRIRCEILHNLGLVFAFGRKGRLQLGI
jgi:hypothetical protein